MKKHILIGTVTMFIFSCGNKQEEEWVCTCQESQKVSDFISANVKSANNMSDEEMEDVIIELRRTGIKLHCHQELLWQNSEGTILWSKNKLDSCETYQGGYGF
jgi:hypothetical protein